MGKLADKIRNLAKAAKSRREPVVGDIEIDDEPYIGDIEVEDSEDDDLDGIVVLTEEDLDNEFSAGAEESRKYGNEATNKKRKKTSSTDERVAKYSDGERNEREDRMRSHAATMNSKSDKDNSGERELASKLKQAGDDTRGKNNKISDNDESTYRTGSRNQRKLADLLGKKYGRR